MFTYLNRNETSLNGSFSPNNVRINKVKVTTNSTITREYTKPYEHLFTITEILLSEHGRKFKFTQLN